MNERKLWTSIFCMPYSCSFLMNWNTWLINRTAFICPMCFALVPMTLHPRPAPSSFQSSIPASLSPSSLSCSMPPLHWDWYNIFHPQLAESLLTNSNCFCTWELGAEAGKTEWGGGEGVAGNTEDRGGFSQTSGQGFCPGLLSALLYRAEKQQWGHLALLSGCLCYYNSVIEFIQYFLF